MAKFDIMPFKSAFGGSTTIRWGQMTASEVFEAGEPVAVVAAGTLTEPTDNAAQWTLAQSGGNVEAGIAAWGPGAGNINPETGVAYTALDNIPYYPINEGTLFITDVVTAAGGASSVDPALTDIGEDYQISYGAADSRWGLERTVALAGVDYIATVVDVLDSEKTPIRNSGNTGVYVVFTITGTLAAA